MPRTLNRLKALAVDKAKSPGRYAEGGGLYFLVKASFRARSCMVSAISISSSDMV